MRRKITPEESKKLFMFCHKHFVYHYDCQIELVDHLASAIEEQWESNPGIMFHAALRNSFGKIGITGFSKIKEQKQKELHLKYNHLLWKYLLEFFGWPKFWLWLLHWYLLLYSKWLTTKFGLLLPILEYWPYSSFITITTFFLNTLKSKKSKEKIPFTGET